MKVQEKRRICSGDYTRSGDRIVGSACNFFDYGSADPVWDNPGIRLERPRDSRCGVRFIARRPDCMQRWTGKKAVSCCRCKSDFTNPTCRDTCCDVSRCAVSLSGRRYWGVLRRYGSRTFSLNEKGTEKISKMKLVKIDKYTFEGVFYIDLCEVKWIQDIDV